VGLAAYGAAFGVAAAAVRAVGRTGGARRRVSRRAGETIAVAEKTEAKPVPYFETLPRTIIDKKTLDALLSTVPKEKWDEPPEDSYLFTLKCYAETYGAGKATKMGWWDFWYLKLKQWEPDEVYLGDLTDMGMTGLETELRMEYGKKLDREGATPLSLPVFPGVFQPTGGYIQWRGKEYFAGDQVQTPVSDGKFAVDFLNNTAFYRAGLKPWQRGLEIGMAHGYFLIGPFVSLGPLRNTPEAATVGLLCGCAIVGLASCGGLLFGATLRPTLFDREGDAKGAGWQEMINWHALGGLGGAGFAHALLTVFGS